MTRIFFIGDTSNRPNWGCRATTQKLRELLGECGEITAAMDTMRPAAPLQRRPPPLPPPRSVGALRRWANGRAAPLHRLALLSAPRFVEKHPPWINSATPRIIEDVSREIRARKIFPHIADAIDSTDVVAINGEGSFLRNQGRLMLLMAYAAKVKFNKPCLILNHCADFSDPRLLSIAKMAYPLVDDALVRDRYSLESSAALRVGKPHGFAADAAFLLQPGLSSPSGIVVGGSAAYMKRTHEFPRLRSAFAALCRKLLHIAPVAITAAGEPDEIILRPVAEELDLPYLGPETPTQRAVDVLGNAALYIGGRWHPSIMALTGGTPIISFSANSDHKSRGIIDLAGIEQEPFCAFRFDRSIDDIVALAARYIKVGDDMRGPILERVAALRETVAHQTRFFRQS